jgi:hypothetical protein
MNVKTITPAELIELLKETDIAKLNGVIVSVLKNLQDEIVLVTFAGDKTIIGQSVKLELWYSDTTSCVKTIFGNLYLYR